MIKRQKTKTIVTKRQRIREKISLFRKKKKNFESDIKNKINPD